jgi:sodium/pantothenate symporter
MLAGFFSYLGASFLRTFGFIDLPVYLHPILLGFVISLLTVVIVSRSTRVTDAEVAYRDALHIAPAELADGAANRRTIFWPTVMMIWGLVSTLVLMLIYVRPYQLATGLVSAPGPYMVWSGEVFIAIVYGGSLIAAGALTRVVLQRQSRHS